MPRTRSQEKYDRNFERLLSGASKVFYEKGYDRASIRDVARETGMSLAGIYYYISGKEELLFQIQKHCFQKVLATLNQNLRTLKTPESKLRALIENHLAFFVGNMREMKVLSHEGESLKGGYYREIAALKRDYVRVASELIAQVAKRHHSNGVEPGTAALCLFGMMNWIYNWYDPKRDGGAQELAKTMERLFLEGLTAKKKS